uniref:Uncharacterized protein n=1 Tax=Anguilla anguilla TaxID=7936 RepID=A0A0E9RB06_ANGAN
MGEDRCRYTVKPVWCEWNLLVGTILQSLYTGGGTPHTHINICLWLEVSQKYILMKPSILQLSAHSAPVSILGRVFC